MEQITVKIGNYDVTFYPTNHIKIGCWDKDDADWYLRLNEEKVRDFSGNFLYAQYYKENNKLIRKLWEIYISKETNCKKVVAENEEHLKQLITVFICIQKTNNADLNNIDVSKITNMHELFLYSQFNGDISRWDVSNVTDMRRMFYLSQFQGDISKWDVSNVTNMYWMFSHSYFSGDISKWDISNVTNMNSMFYRSEFSEDLSNWDTSNVTDMNYMFDNCPMLEEHKCKFND